LGGVLTADKEYFDARTMEIPQLSGDLDEETSVGEYDAACRLAFQGGIEHLDPLFGRGALKRLMRQFAGERKDDLVEPGVSFRDGR